MSTESVDVMAVDKYPEDKSVRIGILLANKNLNIPSLKYFILLMNKQQKHFEYEILPVPWNNNFIKKLNGWYFANRKDREEIRKQSIGFFRRYNALLQDEMKELSQK